MRLNHRSWITRYHRLLSAEGTLYFLLALMDFLTHIVTVLHQDLSVVKLIDLIIGTESIHLCDISTDSHFPYAWILGSRRSVKRRPTVMLYPLVLLHRSRGTALPHTNSRPTKSHEILLGRLYSTGHSV